MAEKVRCETCRRWFDPSDERGWNLQPAADVVEDPEGHNEDWFCSTACLVKHADSEWMDEIDARLRAYGVLGGDPQ